MADTLHGFNKFKNATADFESDIREPHTHPWTKRVLISLRTNPCHNALR